MGEVIAMALEPSGLSYTEAPPFWPTFTKIWVLQNAGMDDKRSHMIWFHSTESGRQE